MLKRLIALLMVAMLCIGYVCVAEATCLHENQILQDTHQNVTKPINGEKHQEFRRYVIMCGDCGRLMSETYSALAGTEWYHTAGNKWFDGGHVSGQAKHVFYKLCTKCNGRTKDTTTDCAGNGLHVTHP